MGFPACHIDLSRLSIRVGDDCLPPVAYTSYFPKGEYYRQVAACGVHLYCFPAYLAPRGINTQSGIGPFRKGIWRAPGEFDFSDIEADLACILSADPSARIIMRLHLDMPEWWEHLYPDACCRRADSTPLRQSFTSAQWRSDAAMALQTAIQWLDGSVYAPHMIAIHVAGGFTEEWFHHYPADRNPSKTQAFSEWLAQRYGGCDAARRAWNGAMDEAAALACIGAPAVEQWRDPVRDVAECDALHFHSTIMADAAAAMCRVVKEESDGRLLAGAFYGYHFFVGDCRRGHTALSRLLDCPHLDFLASPNMYDRRPGIDWPPMAAVDSVRLHGKLWMTENDTRTALTRPLADTAPDICPPGQYRGGIWDGPASMDVSAALLRANTARMLTHGYGGWWFDMWGGWFAHPALLAEIAAAQKLWHGEIEMGADTDNPAEAFVVVVDERLAEYDASFGSLCPAVFNNRYAMGTCGRPYSIYLRNDLPHLEPGRMRCLWMLGIPGLQETEMALLARHATTGCRVLHTDFAATRVLFSTPDCNSEEPVTLTEAALRRHLDASGVHCYSDTSDVLYAGRGYLAIHAATAGEKTIRLPRRMRVEALSPEASGVCEGFQICCSLECHETRIFRLHCLSA